MRISSEMGLRLKEAGVGRPENLSDYEREKVERTAKELEILPKQGDYYHPETGFEGGKNRQLARLS